MNEKKYVPTGDPRIQLPGTMVNVNCRCVMVFVQDEPEQLDLFGEIHAAGMSFEDLMQKVNK